MKRAFTPKVESVTSCAADNDALEKLSRGKLPSVVEGCLKVGSPEFKRRACTSVGMIGLAISMGAYNLLLLQKSSSAIAAEPVAAEPTVTTSAPEEAVVVSLSHKAEEKAEAVPVREAGINAADSSDNASRSIGSVAVKTGYTDYRLLSSEDVASSKLQQSAPATGYSTKVEDALWGEPSKGLPSQASSGEMPVEKSEISPGSANEVLKALQDSALNGVKQQPNRLQNSLAEWRSEESKTTSVGREVDTGVVPQNLQPSTEAKDPAPKALGQAFPLSSPTQSQNTGLAIGPKAASSEVISSQESPETPLESRPEAIDPKAAIFLSQAISPPGKAETPSSSTPIASETTQTPVASATLLVPKPGVVEPQAAFSPTEVYQVKPGDTLDALAQSYGVTPAELLRVNNIENLSQLQINQQLRIPLTKSSTLVADLNPTSGEAKLPGQSPAGAAPSQALPSLSTSVIPASATKPLSGTRPEIAKATFASTLVGSAVPSSTILVARNPSQSALTNSNSQNNPYIDKLKVELLGLRQQYQNQSLGSQTNLVAQAQPFAIPIQVVPPPSDNTQPREQSPVSVPSGQVNLKVPSTSTAIPIPVPPPESNSYPTGRSHLATAPTGTDNYNPATQPPVGQQVAPEIPPQQGPGIYPPSEHLPQFTGYIWPTKGVITSPFGWRWGRMHKGVDIASPIGTPVFAAAPGIVLRAGWDASGYGNLVEIQHPDGSLTRYGHNSRVLVQVGQQVEQGQEISEMGSTGRSTGPHCHFEVHPPGQGAVNPLAFLPRRQNS